MPELFLAFCAVIIAGCIWSIFASKRTLRDRLAIVDATYSDQEKSATWKKSHRRKKPK